MVARIELRTDKFQRRVKSLYAVDTAGSYAHRSVWPIDLEFARPGGALLLESENLNRNVNIAGRAAQLEHACCDKHSDVTKRLVMASALCECPQIEIVDV